MAFFAQMGIVILDIFYFSLFLIFLVIYYICYSSFVISFCIKNKSPSNQFFFLSSSNVINILHFEFSYNFLLTPGIEIGSIVRYSDQDEARNVVEAIDTSTYRSPVYTLKDTIDGTTRTNVQRSEIGTSTWKSIAQLTNQQRTTVWNNTDGFTFDHEEENKYSKGLLQYIPAMTGVVSNALYGGGFASDVPSTLIKFDEHMSTLKRNVWIDDKTRAIEISFNMYNANYDFLIVTTASFDLTPGGGTNPRKTVKVVRLCDNWKAEDLTRIQLEWVCLGLMILGYVSVLLSACSKFMQVPNEKDAKLLNFYDTNAIKNKQSKVRRGRDQKKTNQACTEVFLGCPTRCSRCCGELVSFWNAIEFILLGALVTDLILRNNYQNVSFLFE